MPQTKAPNAKRSNDEHYYKADYFPKSYRQCDEGAEFDMPSLNRIWLVNKTKGVR